MVLKIAKCLCVTCELIHYIMTAATAAIAFVVLDIATAVMLSQIMDMQTHFGYFVFVVLTGVILVTVDRMVFRMFGYCRN